MILKVWGCSSMVETPMCHWQVVPSSVHAAHKAYGEDVMSDDDDWDPPQFPSLQADAFGSLPPGLMSPQSNVPQICQTGMSRFSLVGQCVKYVVVFCVVLLRLQ